MSTSGKYLGLQFFMNVIWSVSQRDKTRRDGKNAVTVLIGLLVGICLDTEE